MGSISMPPWQEIRLLKEEVAFLHQEIQGIQEVDDAEIQELHKELNAARQQLKSALSTTQVAQQVAATAQQQLQQARQQHTETMAALKQEREKQTQELQAKLTAAEAAQQSAQEEAAQAKRQASEMQQRAATEVQTLQRQLKEAREEVARLTRQSSEAQAAEVKLAAELGKANAQVVSLQGEMRDVKTKLAQQVAAAQVERQATDKVAAQVQAAQKELETQRLQIQSHIAVEGTLNRRLAEVTEELGQCQRVVAELTFMRNHLMATVDEEKRKADDLFRDNQGMHAQIQDCQQHIQKLTQEKDAQRRAKHIALKELQQYKQVAGQGPTDRQRAEALSAELEKVRSACLKKDDEIKSWLRHDQNMRGRLARAEDELRQATVRLQQLSRRDADARRPPPSSRSSLPPRGPPSRASHSPSRRRGDSATGRRGRSRSRSPVGRGGRRSRSQSRSKRSRRSRSSSSSSSGRSSDSTSSSGSESESKVSAERRGLHPAQRTTSESNRDDTAQQRVGPEVMGPMEDVEEGELPSEEGPAPAVGAGADAIVLDERPPGVDDEDRSAGQQGAVGALGDGSGYLEPGAACGTVDHSHEGQYGVQSGPAEQQQVDAVQPMTAAEYEDWQNSGMNLPPGNWGYTGADASAGGEQGDVQAGAVWQPPEAQAATNAHDAAAWDGYGVQYDGSNAGMHAAWGAPVVGGAWAGPSSAVVQAPPVLYVAPEVAGDDTTGAGHDGVHRSWAGVAGTQPQGGNTAAEAHWQYLQYQARALGRGRDEDLPYLPVPVVEAEVEAAQAGEGMQDGEPLADVPADWAMQQYQEGLAGSGPEDRPPSRKK